MIEHVVWSCYDCDAVRIDGKDRGEWMYLSNEAYALLMEEVVFKRKWDLQATYCTSCYEKGLTYLELLVNKPPRHGLD